MTTLQGTRDYTVCLSGERDYTVGLSGQQDYTVALLGTVGSEFAEPPEPGQWDFSVARNSAHIMTAGF